MAPKRKRPPPACADHGRRTFVHIQLLRHRLRPHGDGQLDILVQQSIRGSQSKCSRRDRRWIPQEELHRSHHGPLMRYWDTFPGGIAAELAKLWPGREPHDIPHFPASIVQIRAQGPSSRVPTSAVMEWVGWPNSDCTEEPLHQIAEDVPELLHEYCSSHNATTLTPSLEVPHLHQLVVQMRTVKNLIVVTGASISVSAGLPTFADLRSRFGQDVFHTAALATESSTSLFYDLIRHLHQKAISARPTRFHRWLDAQADTGRLRRVYTQNIDGIERQLHDLHPSVPLPFRKPWPRCIQLHGDICHAYCVVCRSVVALEPESFQGSRPPSCRSCASHQRRAAAIGVLRPRIRLYDQDDGAIDDEAIQLVVADDSRAPLDALLVVGTALRIPGAARLVDKLLASVRLFADGGVTAWVNPLVQPPTSLASRFDLKVLVEADALVDMVESIP